MSKKLIILLIISKLLLFLNGCQRHNDITKDKNLLSIALASAPSSINPIKATDATGMRMVSLVYQSLVRVGKDKNQKLAPVGELAQSWTVDGNKHSFFIDAQTKFSDGSTLKCADLKKSIKLYQDKKCPFNSAFSDIKNVSCFLSNKKLILSFTTTSDSEKFLLADLPVLKITKGKLGTGPFIIKENEPTHSLLVKNEFYSTPQSYNLKFFYLKDDLARFLKVYKGEIDIAPNSIPFEKIRSFGSTNLKVLEEPTMSTSYLLINFKNKELRSLSTRKNIFEAIDIPDLVKNRFDNHVTLAKSLLYPGHPYYSRELDKISHKSSSLSASNLKLTLKTSNARQTRETGQIIAHKLKKKNISVDLQSFEWGTFYKDVKSGKYDLALMKWVGVVDPDLYNLAFHSKELPPGRNRGHYKNKVLDQLLEKGRSPSKPSDRLEVYNRIQNMVFEDLAIIPLWHENQIHIVHPRVKGYELNPMGDFSSFLNLDLSFQKKDS